MALSKELEDELTCPIDLEFFIEPMSLKCLHVLCKKDVDHMMQDHGLIVCPQCKTVSHKRDIKHDFRTQRLLGLHTADKDRLKKELACENCEDEVATCRCEQCKGYLGERCVRGHKKFETTKHHIIISLSTITDENSSMIDASIDKLERVSTQMQEVMKKLSSTVANLDIAHINGMATIETSEVTLLQTVSSTFAQMRTKFSSDIARRKKTVERIRSDWQVNMLEVEKEVVTLNDFLGKCDQKAIFNQELVGSLTNQSTQKFERITKELRNCKLPSQEFTVSLNSFDDSVKAIKRLTIETKDSLKGEIAGQDETIHLNDDIFMVRRRVYLQKSEKSSSQQHTSGMTKIKSSATMSTQVSFDEDGHLLLQ